MCKDLIGNDASLLVKSLREISQYGDITIIVGYAHEIAHVRHFCSLAANMCAECVSPTMGSLLMSWMPLYIEIDDEVEFF